MQEIIKNSGVDLVEGAKIIISERKVAQKALLVWKLAQLEILL